MLQTVREFMTSPSKRFLSSRFLGLVCPCFFLSSWDSVLLATFCVVLRYPDLLKPFQVSLPLSWSLQYKLHCSVELSSMNFRHSPGDYELTNTRGCINTKTQMFLKPRLLGNVRYDLESGKRNMLLTCASVTSSRCS